MINHPRHLLQASTIEFEGAKAHPPSNKRDPCSCDSADDEKDEGDESRDVGLVETRRARSIDLAAVGANMDEEISLID